MFTRIAIYRILPSQGRAHDQAAERCQGVLVAQPGFLGRLLGRNDDDADEYVEAIQWESPAHAEEAFVAVSQDAAVRAWLRHVDTPTVKMFGMRTVGVIGRQERALADPTVGTWLLVRWRTLGHVDGMAHTRNELLMHHEAFAPVAGYGGAVVLEELDGGERMELIAWPSSQVARNCVADILGAGHALVVQHMGDCAPGASLHYLDPVLRT
jgi:hypothetical protein